MNFNIWVVVFFLAVWLVQIVLSILDDTFYDNQHKALDMPLSRHWGVLIGDPILAVMNGFIFPHLNFGWHSWFFLLVSILISWELHKSWWNIKGHIFPNHNKSEWKRGYGSPAKYWCFDLSEAGWAHLVFFIFQVEIILEFVITPIPVMAVKIVTGLFLAFAPFGVFQPGYAEWRKKRLHNPNAKWFLRSSISLTALWAATLIVACIKSL